jgi:hypothetical protein
MTTALERAEGSASRPGRSLPPGKAQYPLYRRLVGPGRQVRKISPSPGFNPRTIQSVTSRYTKYAAALPLGNNSGNHEIWCSVGPGDSLNVLQNRKVSRTYRDPTPDRLARSLFAPHSTVSRLSVLTKIHFLVFNPLNAELNSHLQFRGIIRSSQYFPS